LPNLFDPPAETSATIAPKTSTATSHAIAIKSGSATVGRIQSWSPNQSRAVTAIYEINAATMGDVAENVPGVASGLTIQVMRYDLFSTRMEEAWGEDFQIREMLCNQANPLNLQEKWVYPDGTFSVYMYSGCWFSNMGRTMSVQGDRIINVSATIQYERKRKFI
jgi:hypothetical protein